MGCPIHIWAPMLAGLVPIARVAKDRLHSVRYRRAEPESPREMKRWAPIQPTAAREPHE